MKASIITPQKTISESEFNKIKANLREDKIPESIVVGEVYYKIDSDYSQAVFINDGTGEVYFKNNTDCISSDYSSDYFYDVYQYDKELSKMDLIVGSSGFKAKWDILTDSYSEDVLNYLMWNESPKLATFAAVKIMKNRDEFSDVTVFNAFYTAIGLDIPIPQECFSGEKNFYQIAYENCDRDTLCDPYSGTCHKYTDSYINFVNTVTIEAITKNQNDVGITYAALLFLSFNRSQENTDLQEPIKKAYEILFTVCTNTNAAAEERYLAAKIFCLKNYPDPTKAITNQSDVANLNSFLDTALEAKDYVFACDLLVLLAPLHPDNFENNKQKVLNGIIDNQDIDGAEKAIAYLHILKINQSNLDSILALLLKEDPYKEALFFHSLYVSLWEKDQISNKHWWKSFSEDQQLKILILITTYNSPVLLYNYWHLITDEQKKALLTKLCKSDNKLLIIQLLQYVDSQPQSFNELVSIISLDQLLSLMDDLYDEGLINTAPVSVFTGMMTEADSITTAETNAALYIAGLVFYHDNATADQRDKALKLLGWDPMLAITSLSKKNMDQAVEFAEFYLEHNVTWPWKVKPIEDFIKKNKELEYCY